MAFLMTPPTAATLPVAEMSSVRTHTVRLLRQHRRQLSLVLGLHTLAAVAALAAPRIVGLLVDTVTQQGDVESVNGLAGALAVAVAVQTVLTWFARRASFRMGEDFFAELREQFMTRVVSLPLSTVERAGTGDLVSRTTNDVEALSYVARFGIPSIFVAAVTVTITVVAAFLTGWMVALAIVVGFPLLWFSTRWYLRYAPDGYLRERATYAVMNGVVTETVDGSRTVDALRLRRRRRARIDRAIGDAYDAEMYTLRLRMWWFPQVEVAYLLPVAVTLLWGGVLVANGQTTVGTVTAVALYVQALAMPLDELLMWLDEIQVAATSLARVIGIADVPPDRSATGETPTCTSRLTTSGMRTGPVATCSRACPSTSCRANGWPSSGRRERASRRWAGSWPESTGRGPDGSTSAACGWSTWSWSGCAVRSPSWRRSTTSSSAPSRTTCCWPGRVRHRTPCSRPSRRSTRGCGPSGCRAGWRPSSAAAATS
jgi:ABC-type multidrug transport system fused ATPase/permease subunit